MKPDILIVDDKVENLITLQEILDELEITVVSAKSGNEAVSHCMRTEFALILMDVQMPEMDGFEAMSLVRKCDLNQDTPVIFLSAIYSDDFYKIKGISQGAVDFMTKPVAEGILLGKIQVFLKMFAQKKQLQQQMKEIESLNRDVQHFSQILAHELKQPLSAVLGFSQMLQINGESLKPEQMEQVDFIHRSGEIMNQIINDAIDLIKTQNEGVSLAPLDLNRLIRSITDTFVSNGEKNIYFEIASLPEIKSSELLLRSIFRNLIGNSVKYNERDPVRIKIIYRSTESGHEFEIEDNGIGIPEEMRDEIFKPFKRAAGSKYEGSGIGLSIVSSAVEKLKGEISVKKTGQEGSVFRLYLPR